MSSVRAEQPFDDGLDTPGTRIRDALLLQTIAFDIRTPARLGRQVPRLQCSLAGSLDCRGEVDVGRLLQGLDERLEWINESTGGGTGAGIRVQALEGTSKRLGPQLGVERLRPRRCMTDESLCQGGEEYPGKNNFSYVPGLLLTRTHE